MTTQTFELITDAELIAASGGGFGGIGKAIMGGFALGAGQEMLKHPDKVIETASAVHDAVTSKDKLQNLQLGIA